MKYLHNPHPGEILLTEFMEPIKLSTYRLAKDLHIPEFRIGKIVTGESRITADTTRRLEIFFGMSATFWLGLQNDYDLLEEKRAKENQPLFIKLYEKITADISPRPRKKTTMEKAVFRHKQLHKV